MKRKRPKIKQEESISKEAKARKSLVSILDSKYNERECKLCGNKIDYDVKPSQLLFIAVGQDGNSFASKLSIYKNDKGKNIKDNSEELGKEINICMDCANMINSDLTDCYNKLKIMNKVKEVEKSSSIVDADDITKDLYKSEVFTGEFV